MTNFNEIFLLCATIVTGVSSQGVRPMANSEFLGSQPTKLYFFPWMVSIHRESGVQRELMGSASVLTHRYMLGSMDSFVRYSKFTGGSKGIVFYQDVGHLWAYSGTIWGGINIRTEDISFPFLQKRQVEKLYMFYGPHVKEPGPLQTFDKFSQPLLLNTLARSPFGFSMSIALIKLTDEGEWIFKRGCLPIPLVANRAAALEIELQKHLDSFGDVNHNLECFVAGWRNGDHRLVQYRMFYTHLEQCAIAYCGYDNRGCYNWPVNGTHVCFKSESYDDLCWRDQGSALFCPSLNNSVIAILTTSPTCGTGNLPAVFTLVDKGLLLFERGAFPREEYKPIPESEKNKYTPPPEDRMYPAYR